MMSSLAHEVAGGEAVRRPAAQGVVQSVASLQLGMGWFAEQPGGLDRFYVDLVRHFHASGARVQGLVAGTKRADAESRGLVRSFAAADAPLWRRWLGVRSSVRQELSLHRPDVVASHFALYAFPVLGLVRELPHIVHFHGPWAAECAKEGAAAVSTAVKHRIERRVYRRADRLIVLCKPFGEILCREYGVAEDRVRVIPGGVDVAAFEAGTTRAEARELLGWPGDRPIVLAVRRLVSRMGLEDLVDASAIVRRKVPDVFIAIAGKGRLIDALAGRIREAGLENHVRLLGFVPDEHLALAYRAADLSVVPTVALEGFGLIAIESLAAGTPVLVTPVGGLPEAVGALSPNLVLPATGAEAIAEGIGGALSGRLAMPTAAACREYAAGFDWPVIAARVAEVYREAVASG